jgi:hypothetical protein
MFLEGRALHWVYCRSDKSPIGGWKSAVVGFGKRTRGPNVGVATGKINGIVVVDVDPRHGGDKTLAEHLAWLPTTRTHRTGGSGLHLIFKYPAQGIRNFTGTEKNGLPGIELKSEGYGVVWPPSPGYTVIDDRPMADFPERLRELVMRPRELDPSSFSQGAIRKEGASLVAVSNDRLPRELYLKVLRLCPLGQGVTRQDQRRLCGVLSISLRQKSERGVWVWRTSMRNKGLFDASVAMRELIGLIDYGEAVELLLDTARINGYVAKRGEAKALTTIHSGLSPPPSAIGEAPSLLQERA